MYIHLPTFVWTRQKMHVAIFCSKVNLPPGDIYKVFSIHCESVSILHINKCSWKPCAIETFLHTQNAGMYKRTIQFVHCFGHLTMVEAFHFYVNFEIIIMDVGIWVHWRYCGNCRNEIHVENVARIVRLFEWKWRVWCESVKVDRYVLLKCVSVEMGFLAIPVTHFTTWTDTRKDAGILIRDIW